MSSPREESVVPEASVRWGWQVRDAKDCFVVWGEGGGCHRCWGAWLWQWGCDRAWGWGAGSPGGEMQGKGSRSLSFQSRPSGWRTRP